MRTKWVLAPACLLLASAPMLAQLPGSEPQPPGARLRLSRLGRQPSPQSRAMEQSAAALRDALAALRPAFDASERRLRIGRPGALDAGELSAARRRLDTAMTGARALFADIERKLGEPGLETQLKRWQVARERIEQRAGQVAMWSGQLEASLRAGDARAADAYLELARASLAQWDGGAAETPKAIRHRDADPVPTQRLQPVGRRSMAAAEPTQADLAETKLVQITEPIRAKALELGKEPVAIYRYVKENTDVEIYYGFMQGSAGVYWSGRGNAWDLSAYLIAHFRAAGIPARFAMGFVSMPYETAMEWLGTTNKAATDRMLKATTYTETGEKVVKIDHIWVEAYIDTPDGKQWVRADPTKKRKQWPATAILPRVALDRMKYLTSAKTTVLATDAYIDQLRDALRQRDPGRSLLDGVRSGRMLEIESGDAFEIEDLYFQQSEPDAKFQHRATITVKDGNDTLVTTSVRLAETALAQWSVTFAAATAADERVLRLFGGLEAAPPAAVGLVPQIRLDGKVVAAGTKDYATGTALTVLVDYIRGGQTAASYTGNHTVRAGETAVLNFHAFQSTDRFVGKLVDELNAKLAANASTDPDARVRDLLRIAGLRYFHRYWLEKQRLGGPLGMRPAIPSGEEAATEATLEVQQIFDVPFVVTPGRMVIDADGMTTSMYDYNSDVTVSAELTNIRQTLGLASSSLEHELWEEVAYTAAASTTRVLQLAARGGIAIKTITKDNAATEVAKLQLADANKTSIRAEADKGNVVLAPEQPVTYGSWRGAAWISEDANGYGSFIISRYSGGDTGGNKPEKQAGAGTSGDNGTSCGSPVSVTNGNMFHQFVDLELRGRGLPLRLVRTYNSQSAQNGPFGYGWTHNLMPSLTAAASNAIFTDDSGGRFVFTQQTSTTYETPGTLDATLTRDAQGFTLRRGDGGELRFNTSGRLEKLSDWRGNAQTLRYDTRGNLIEVEDASAGRLTLRYDVFDRVVELSDQTGRRVAYTYDTRGDLVAVVNAAGNRTTFNYYTTRGWEHNLKQIVFPEGGAITFEYYGNDRVARVVDQAGGEMRFFYLPIRGETVVVDERGLATSYTYDAAGNITRIVRPDGAVVTHNYNAAGRVTSTQDEAGYVTAYEYDARGRLTRAVHPDGGAVQYTYESAFNQVTSMRDRKGNVTRFEYDAKGNLTKVTDALGNELKYTYTSDGLLASTVDGEGRTTTYKYDGQGRRTDVVDPAGNTYRMRYDGVGRVVAMVDAAGQETRAEYDAAGNLTRLVNRAGDSIRYEYDRNGNRVRRVDARGKARRYSFDKLDALADVTDALGNVTRYTNAPADCACTSNGALAAVSTPAGRTTRIAYDENGRVGGFTDAAGHAGRLWYDARGRGIQVTDRDGNTATAEYDALGWLKRRAFADGSSEVYARDANGNILSVATGDVIFSYAYDAVNRVTSVTDSRTGKAVRYTFDKSGRRASMTDADGGVTRYSYDKAGQLAAIVNARGETFQFTYNGLGRRSAMTLPNGVQAAYEYDKSGRLTTLRYRDKGGAVLAEWTYRYDANGNPVAAATPAGEHAWQYDDLNRVVGATHPEGPAETYRYDADGNLEATASMAIAYNAAGHMTSAGDAAYTYDRRGNPVKRVTGAGTTQYTYNQRRWLTKVELPDGRVVTYRYDVAGQRIAKSVDGVETRYVYDSLDLLAETDATGKVLASYTYGPEVDEPLAMYRDGKAYYYLADGLRNVAHLVDAAGAVVQSYAYEAYGRIVPGATETVVANPFTFAGRELDGETGLMYFRARYYDPSVGRFLQQDALSTAKLLRVARGSSAELAQSILAVRLRNAQSANAYGYASGNPLTRGDPLGLIDFGPHPYTAEQCGVKVLPCKAGQTPGIIPGLTHMVQSFFVESSDSGPDPGWERREAFLKGWRELTNQVEYEDYLDVCDPNNPRCRTANQYRADVTKMLIDAHVAMSTTGSPDIPAICEKVDCDLKKMRETGIGTDKEM